MDTTSSAAAIDADDPLASLIDCNWLASCGGGYRRGAVGAADFAAMPTYLEWTFLASRLLRDGRIGFLFEPDAPQFRVHDTAGSLSRSLAYLLAMPENVERLRDPATPEEAAEQAGEGLLQAAPLLVRGVRAGHRGQLDDVVALLDGRHLQAARRLRQRQGGGDGGVQRCFEEQRLGQPEAQQVADRRRSARHPAGQGGGDQVVELAQPAQDRTGEQPGEGAVARRQLGLGRRFVQRLVAAQHALHQGQRPAPRRHPGCLTRRGPAWAARVPGPVDFRKSLR